jgi:hypothetical protein
VSAARAARPAGSGRRRLLAAGVAVTLGALPLTGCAEVESGTVSGYEPSKLEPVKGSDDVKLVTFTREGAERTGLRTATVRRSGRHQVIPYRALIYDPHGTAYVYTSPRPLTFLRQRIVVDRVQGDRVLLSDGPPTGTAVVTVGAAEVYGTELEIGSGH